VQLVKLTAGTTWHETPAISPDERHLAFTSFATQARPPSIWLRDMQTGMESQIAASNGAQRYPAIDHRGSRVAFTSYDPEGRSVYVARSGLPAERVCEGCFRATDWSPDDEALLLCTGSPYHVERLQLRSRRRDVLLSDPNHHLMYGKYSPDGQWVSFTRRLDEGRGQITIAPINRPNAAAEAEWIVVASASGDDWANWSADGRMLYYSSSVDGHACLWGQRLHKQTKRLLGEPFALEHFHGRASFDHGGWSVAREHIVVSLLERYGNIWLFGGPARR
jgi:Tol biopolymer transport system component